MSTDKIRDEALANIAEQWRNAAAIGCVDAFECALRDAWKASRAALVVELPPRIAIEDAAEEADLEDERAYAVAHMVNGAIAACGAFIKEAGVKVKE
jgi:hypothetical protein